MVWSRFSCHGTGRLHVIEGMMDGAMCWKIPKMNLLPSTGMMRMKGVWTTITNKGNSLGLRDRKYYVLNTCLNTYPFLHITLFMNFNVLISWCHWKIYLQKRSSIHSIIISPHCVPIKMANDQCSCESTFT